MKINHYIKDYSFEDKKKLSIITSEMEYSYKLSLLKSIRNIELPGSLIEALSIKQLISPLSNRKKMQVLLNSKSLRINYSKGIFNEYNDLVKKNSRKNKVSSLPDLIDLNNILHTKSLTDPYNYVEKCSSFLGMDGLSFKVGPDTYSFYIPKNQAEFGIAANQLHTCVGRFALDQGTSHFKFFIKKDDRFFSSVMYKPTKRNGHIGELEFYANSNKKPALDIQIQATKALKPFFKQWETINFKEFSYCIKFKPEVSKTYTYSKTPKKIYNLSVQELISENQADPKVFYYQSVFVDSQRWSQCVFKNYKNQWFYILIDKNNAQKIYHLWGHECETNPNTIKDILELKESDLQSQGALSVLPKKRKPNTP